MKLSVIELGRELRTNAELLANVNADLERCPTWKLTHQWGLDRIQAREQLLSSRERLQGALRELVLSN